MNNRSVRLGSIVPLAAGGLLGIASLPPATLAQGLDGLAEPLRAAPLMLDTASAYAGARGGGNEPPAGAAAAESTPTAAPKNDAGKGRFGLPGGWWLTLGGGYANNFDHDQDFNLHVAFSTFLAKELEFSIELAAWYFDQEGSDTGGINPSMVFRWHFWHADDFSWTVYGDVGIGLLFAFDDVPAGGTGFNFTPRAGVGYTTRIGDDDTRLQIGVRYHHISNGRIEGDDRNPSRDSIMVYAGIIFPF